jgi:hypothetical protein
LIGFYGIDIRQIDHKNFKLITNVEVSQGGSYRERALGDYHSIGRAEAVIKEIVDHYIESQTDPERSVYVMP